MAFESILAQMSANDVPEPKLPLTIGKKVGYGPEKKAWYRIREWVSPKSGKAYYSGYYGYKDQWWEIESDYVELTPEEKAAYRAEREAAERAEAEHRAKAAQFAANRAKDQWSKASPEGSSAYFARKQVQGVSCRYMADGWVIIPLLRYDESPARMVGSQKISPEGVKRVNKDMDPIGAACRIGAEPVDGDLIVLAEGYATALSIHHADASAFIFMCLNSGNLLHVARILRARFPRSPFLFAADDDYLPTKLGKENHAGEKKAKAAAEAVGNARVVLPKFSVPRRAVRDDESLPELVDFNDLHCAEGIEAVRAQLFGEPEIVADASEVEEKPEAATPKLQVTLDDSPPIDPPPLELAGGIKGGEGRALANYEYLVRHVALVAGKTRVFDYERGVEMSVNAARMIYGSRAVGQWLELDAKRVIEGFELVRKKREVEKERVSNDQTFQDILSRYVFIDGTDSIFDMQLHKTISQGALKLAIGEAFPEWVNHPARRVIPAENLVFDPTGRVNDETHINLFRGLPLEPDFDHPERCQPIIDLLVHLCNEDSEAFDWLCKWLAYPLQMRTTGGKMDTAVLIHGDEQGSGKSLFFELCYKPIFGPYATTLSQHQLDSQYTAWRSSKMFCLFEEVLSNNQKYSHTGTLKQMITGKTQQIERKFVDAWEEANYLNAVFLSNALQPFHLEPKDRRFLVIWPEKPLPPKAQQAVEDCLAHGGVEAFFGWLLSFNIDGFTPHTKPPMTPAKRRLIDHGMATWEVFLRDWQDGSLGIPYGAVPTSYLFSVYTQWCERGREGKPLSLHRFSTTLAAKMHKSTEHYRIGTVQRQRVFFYLRGHEPTRDVVRQDWFGSATAEFRMQAEKSGWSVESMD